MQMNIISAEISSILILVGLFGVIFTIAWGIEKLGELRALNERKRIFDKYLK